MVHEEGEYAGREERGKRKRFSEVGRASKALMQGKEGLAKNDAGH